MPLLSISECDRKMKNINLILTYKYELGLKLIFNIPIQFTFVDNNDDDGNNILILAKISYILLIYYYAMSTLVMIKKERHKNSLQHRIFFFILSITR